MEGFALIPRSPNRDFMKADMNMLSQSLITFHRIPLCGMMCLRYSITSSSELISFLVAHRMICLEVIQFMLMIMSIPSSSHGSFKSIYKCVYLHKVLVKQCADTHQVFTIVVKY